MQALIETVLNVTRRLKALAGTEAHVSVQLETDSYHGDSEQVAWTIYVAADGLLECPIYRTGEDLADLETRVTRELRLALALPSPAAAL